MSPLIAIDGPAGSGKSTVSRALAEHLDVDRLDTGAMYRAVAWAALEQGTDPADAPAVATLAQELDIEVADVVKVGPTNVTAAIRTPRVGQAVSVVAANPGVRRVLVERQRAWAGDRGGHGVVEGRDIATVVFPHADLKIYLTAKTEERVRRRQEEGAGAIVRRDHLDSTRAASPLAQAPDARVIDTTSLSISEVVAEIISWL